MILPAARCQPKFGYSAKQTLGLIQRLYETHRFSLPKDRFRHITEDIVPTLPDRLKSISVGPYAEPARALLRGGL